MNTDNQAIAVVRQTTTVSITFVEKPNEQQRTQLKEAGYRYENGNWYRSQSQGQFAAEETVANLLKA